MICYYIIDSTFFMTLELQFCAKNDFNCCSVNNIRVLQHSHWLCNGLGYKLVLHVLVNSVNYICLYILKRLKHLSIFVQSKVYCICYISLVFFKVNVQKGYGQRKDYHETTIIQQVINLLYMERRCKIQQRWS